MRGNSVVEPMTYEMNNSRRKNPIMFRRKGKKRKTEIQQLRGIHVYFNEFEFQKPRPARGIANPRDGQTATRTILWQHMFGWFMSGYVEWIKMLLRSYFLKFPSNHCVNDRKQLDLRALRPSKPVWLFKIIVRIWRSRNMSLRPLLVGSWPECHRPHGMI